MACAGRAVATRRPTHLLQRAQTGRSIPKPKHIAQTMKYLFGLALMATLTSNCLAQEADSQAEQLFASIPSPAKLATLLLLENVEYPRQDMQEPQYTYLSGTDSDKMVYLGMFYTDLLVALAYQKDREALAYLETVAQLLRELNLAPNWDKRSLINSIRSGEDFNTQLNKAGIAQEQILNAQLKESEILEGSFFMVGNWLEAMNLSINSYEQNPSEDLQEHLGSQKFVLNNLVSLLKPYQSKRSVERILLGLGQIQKEYENVEFTYSNAEKKDHIQVQEQRVDYGGGPESKLNIPATFLENLKKLVNQQLATWQP